MGFNASVIDDVVLGLIMSILTGGGGRVPDMLASSLDCHLPVSAVVRVVFLKVGAVASSGS